jgi:hypothetical protein
LQNLIRMVVLGSSLLGLTGGVAQAVSFDLNCMLSNSACTPFANSFGTVTITDIVGGVSVIVDTAAGGKYKDLFLNLEAPGAVSLTSPAVYSSNTFTLSPYNGAFDVGTSTTPSKGFDGNDNVAFQILGTGFTAADFVALDSLNQVHLAVHLQEIDCGETTCTGGSGSIKVGGTYIPPPPGDDDPGIPEPSTVAIVGLGLTAIGLWRRKAR